jgi:hypothetical protein
MVPVYIGRSRKVSDSFGEFTSEFLKICRSHQEQKRALAFAFILYDFDHPEIRKVLADQDYWDALDHISGTTLTVFSFHIDENRRTGSHSHRGETFAESQQFLTQRFGVAIPKGKPSILFFQVTKEEVSNPCIIAVRANTVEEAFNEIRGILLDAVDSLSQVQPEFRGNTREIFIQLEQRLSQRKALSEIKRVARLAGAAKDLITKLHP